MSDHDSIATGREGGLKSGRTRRIQGALAAVDAVIGELDDMTDQQRATFIRGLANAVREVSDWRPKESVPGE